MAGSYGKSVFSFVRNCQTVFQSVCTILHSHQQRMSSYCSTSSPGFGVVRVLDFGLYNRCVVVFHCCFNLQFPNDISYRTYFHMLICHLYIFFGEVTVQIFCPFLIGLFVFSLLNFKSSLYILDNCQISDMSFANIFFPVCGLSPHFLTLSFTGQKS